MFSALADEALARLEKGGSSMLAMVAVSFMNHSTQLLRTVPEFQGGLLSLSYRKGHL